MTYEELKDRLNELGAKVGFGITNEEEKELVSLLEKRKSYTEYEVEKLKEEYLLMKLKKPRR